VVKTDALERFLAGPVLWAGLALVSFFALGPFGWIALASIKTDAELYLSPI